MIVLDTGGLYAAQVKYAPFFLVFIRFVGTHTEYDRIDANKV